MALMPLMGFTLWVAVGFGIRFGFWPWTLLAGLPGTPPAPGTPAPAPIGFSLENVPNKFIFGFGCGAAMHNCTWNEKKKQIIFLKIW